MIPPKAERLFTLYVTFGTWTLTHDLNKLRASIPGTALLILLPNPDWD